MKRLLVPIFLITMIIMNYCVPTHAAILPNDNNFVLFEAHEITNHKALIDRMEKGITDDYLNIDTKIAGDIFVDEKGIQYKAIVNDKKTTSQKIKSTYNVDGTTTDLYVANANIECLLIPVQNGNEIIIQGSGNSNERDDDKNSLSEVWVRLYYEYHTDIAVDGTSGTMLRPIRTQAWVVRKEPQIVYDYLKLWQGGLGPHYTNYNGTGHLGNGIKKDQQDIYSVVPGTTYTVNGNNSYCWWYLTGYQDYLSAAVSAESETRFHRGGSSWTLRATISKGNPM